MLLSQKLAGFTGGQADTLRKAMGKKQRAVLDKLKSKFIEGAQANGHDEKICEKIWKDWEAFAEYAFNKSHSTCYAYVSYQTGYLKAHYPAEFMAALLSRNVSDIKSISFFMDECKRMGVPVLGPDVNASRKRFASDGNGVIRFGLQAIKGVGENAVEHIIEERKRGGEFKSIFDFVERINLQTVNRKNMENLALAGALDNISGFHRCKFFAPDARDSSVTFLEQLIRYGNRIQNERNNTQQSLFGDMGGSSASIQKPEFPDGWIWSKLETLNKEREVVGIYLSAHPLDDYRVVIENFCKTEVADLSDLAPLCEKDFAVAGMVTDVQHLTSKTGKPYGRFTLEGYKGTHQFTLFGKDYEKFRPLMFNDYALMVRGRVVPKMYNDKELEPRINSVVQLSEAQQMIREVTVTLPIGTLTGEMVGDFTTVAGSSKGDILLRVKVFDPDSGVALSLFSKKLRIDLTRELIGVMEDNNMRYTVN
jgi:DNA polymerase-3 subunit alpha